MPTVRIVSGAGRAVKTRMREVLLGTFCKNAYFHIIAR